MTQWRSSLTFVLLVRLLTVGVAVLVGFVAGLYTATQGPLTLAVLTAIALNEVLRIPEHVRPPTSRRNREGGAARPRRRKRRGAQPRSSAADRYASST